MTPTTPENGGKECIYDYADLSTADLAKRINEEYSVIQQAEAEAGRKNLQRARALAVKLGWLRARAAHGEWKVRFRSYGLQISYETAALYLRIADHWETVLKRAREKGVDPTLLTIDAARELLTTKKPKEEKKDDKNINGSGNGTGNATGNETGKRVATELEGNWDGKKIQKLGDFLVEKTTPDELFPYLKGWTVDELRKLHALIGEHISNLGKQSVAAPQIGAQIGAASVGASTLRRV